MRQRLAEDLRLFGKVLESTFRAVSRRALLRERAFERAEAEALRDRYLPPPACARAARRPTYPAHVAPDCRAFPFSRRMRCLADLGCDTHAPHCAMSPGGHGQGRWRWGAARTRTRMSWSGAGVPGPERKGAGGDGRAGRSAEERV